MEDLTPLIREVKRRKSTGAFYKIVQACEARVFTMCYRIIGNREEAEEAAQDVFLSCFKNIQSLEDDDKFIQWILRIAYYKSIDYVRKKKVMQVELKDKILQDPALSTTPKPVENDDLDSYLIPCDEEEKAIITLYYQEGYSTKEIAKILSLTVSNVKIKLYRARNKIKEFIENKNLSTKS